MRKNQVLVVVVALLFCSAVAVQAQVAVIQSQDGFGVAARMGGAAELTGRIVLNKTLGTVPSGATISVLYSAPVAKGFDVSTASGGTGVNTATMPDTENDALVMYNLADADLYVIPAVRVDVRGVESGVVTAQVSSNSDAVLLSGTVEVITSIDEPVMVSAGDAGTSVLMRGEGAKSKSIAIAEGFGTAFGTDVGLSLKVSGLPEGASLMIAATGHATTSATSIGGNVSLGATEIITSKVVAMTTPVGDDPAVPVAHEVAGAKGGEDVTVTVDFSDAVFMNLTKESLGLKLTFMTDDAKPPFMGDVRVSVTMTPGPPAAGTDPDGTAFFAENFVPADGAQVFMFTPATCTLLFPYAVSLPDMGWDTGIAVTNPSAFTSTPLNGTLTFTLYANDADADMPMVYTTAAGTPGALNDEGMLEAGGTYTVRVRELLDWVDHTGNFQGHLYVKTEFTGCRGVGWVTDFSTINQAYLPYFDDNLDKGDVPGQ